MWVPFSLAEGEKLGGKREEIRFVPSIEQNRCINGLLGGRGEKSGGDKDGASYLPSSNFPSWLFFRGENGGKGNDEGRINSLPNVVKFLEPCSKHVFPRRAPFHRLFLQLVFVDCLSVTYRCPLAVPFSRPSFCSFSFLGGGGGARAPSPSLPPSYSNPARKCRASLCPGRNGGGEGRGAIWKRRLFSRRETVIAA